MTDWQVIQSVALASLLAWASGIRLYLVVFALGLAGYFGYLELPSGLKVLQHPWVIGASGFMLLVEFVADKVPAIDSAWDAIHTFIRIPAGAQAATGPQGFASFRPADKRLPQRLLRQIRPQRAQAPVASRAGG